MTTLRLGKRCSHICRLGTSAIGTPTCSMARSLTRWKREKLSNYFQNQYRQGIFNCHQSNGERHEDSPRPV